ncbi:MAG TPA: hypothetical protein VJH88_00370 [Candidatus Nanoarchaeia archaeon]|nr:hypothetical protein [Candidatus Nanoarchaeia archaeon]
MSRPTYICQPLLERLDDLAAETNNSQRLAHIVHLQELAQRSGTVRYHSLKAAAGHLRISGSVIDPVVFYLDPEGSAEIPLVGFGPALAARRSQKPDTPIITSLTMGHYERGAFMPSSAVLERIAREYNFGWAYLVPRQVTPTAASPPLKSSVNPQLLFSLVERCFKQ